MSQAINLADLLAAHLPHPQVGKVRDTYRLYDYQRPYQPIALPVVSNRASIFDFKLGFPIEGKGEILNAFNIAAKLLRRKVLPKARDDLIAFGPAIDEFLPFELQKNPELYRRAVVVDFLEMDDKECVVRGYATGSFMKAYKKGERRYCGHVLPDGLVEGAKFPEPLFTPTTKAKMGHDEPLDYRDVDSELGDISIQDYKLFAEHSLKGGVIGVDVKFEYGRRRKASGRLSKPILADEAWTVDSSRFWSQEEYKKYFPFRLPTPMDKQALRNWGIEMGIDKLDPKNPEHVAEVLQMVAPPEVIDEYLKQIHRAFEMIWSESLLDFQKNQMHIN